MGAYRWYFIFSLILFNAYIPFSYSSSNSVLIEKFEFSFTRLPAPDEIYYSPSFKKVGVVHEAFFINCSYYLCMNAVGDSLYILDLDRPYTALNRLCSPGHYCPYFGYYNKYKFLFPHGLNFEDIFGFRPLFTKKPSCLKPSDFLPWVFRTDEVPYVTVPGVDGSPPQELPQIRVHGCDYIVEFFDCSLNDTSDCMARSVYLTKNTDDNDDDEHDDADKPAENNPGDSDNPGTNPGDAAPDSGPDKPGGGGSGASSGGSFGGGSDGALDGGSGLSSGGGSSGGDSGASSGGDSSSGVAGGGAGTSAGAGGSGGGSDSSVGGGSSGGGSSGMSVGGVSSGGSAGGGSGPVDGSGTSAGVGGSGGGSGTHTGGSSSGGESGASSGASGDDDGGLSLPGLDIPSLSLAPLWNIWPSARDFKLSLPSAHCPVFDFNIFGNVYKLDAFCTVITPEMIAYIRLICVLAASVFSFIIVLRA